MTTHRPVAETAYGPVRGTDDGKAMSWKGIPYGSPPFGPLRFRAPEPPKPWTQPIEATAFGSVCPQPTVPNFPLDLGAPTRPRGLLLPPPGPVRTGRHLRVRVVPGPHPVSADRWHRLLSERWVVGPASNRIGLRLEPFPGGSPAVAAPAERIPSTGMVTGAVQLPPDGHPIVLMPDHATVGGYPVACCVISADFPVLGQLAPGDTLALGTVDVATARRVVDSR